MKDILIDGIVAARYITMDDYKKGLSFFSKDEEFIQVGAWNYDKDKILLTHFHNKFDRNFNRTNEVLIVMQGSIKADIFTFEGTLIETVILNSNEILILIECAHGYKILEDNTLVIEVKNGPYFGPDIDRTRI